MGASDHVADAIMKLVASDQAQPHAGRPGKPVMLPDASIAFAAVTLIAFNAGTATGAVGCQCGPGALTQKLHLELPKGGEAASCGRSARVPLIDSSNTCS